jgi:lipopolysaccharide/colanic/teichoic acid biosynthesis glycosyltransferase
MCKRIFDFICSLGCLIVISPILFIFILLIWLEDRKSPFYIAPRIGLNGKMFKIIKLRTMVIDAEKYGVHSTAADDKRITRVGKILRKYKLDEMLQLVNVVKGEMSMVGPRPQVAWAVESYSEEEKKVLLNMRPGITDEASIKFRNEGEILKGSSDPDKDYFKKIHPEKMRLSMAYAKKMSLGFDLKILFRTFLCIFIKEA